MLHEKKEQQQQMIVVRKGRLGAAVVMEDERVQVNRIYNGGSGGCCHLWRVRHRDR